MESETREGVGGFYTHADPGWCTPRRLSTLAACVGPVCTAPAKGPQKELLGWRWSECKLLKKMGLHFVDKTPWTPSPALQSALSMCMLCSLSRPHCRQARTARFPGWMTVGRMTIRPEREPVSRRPCDAPIPFGGSAGRRAVGWSPPRGPGGPGQREAGQREDGTDHKTIPGAFGHGCPVAIRADVVGTGRGVRHSGTVCVVFRGRVPTANRRPGNLRPRSVASGSVASGSVVSGGVVSGTVAVEMG